MRAAALGVSWALAAFMTALEALLAVEWLRGILYLARFGASENPYAAEDTAIAGICGLYLLPLFLAALALAAYVTVRWKKRDKTRQE